MVVSQQRSDSGPPGLPEASVGPSGGNIRGQPGPHVLPHPLSFAPTLFLSSRPAPWLSTQALAMLRTVT